MIRARAGALVPIAALLAAAGAFVLASSREQPATEASRRPALLLLTSLPLVFGEEFSIEGGGSPALTALRGRYRVVPISVTDPPELAKGPMLLMAHPLAQTPENLVALDRWVRAGGRLLLFADPMLEWPSVRPLGDLRRPPPMFTDTGLLAHWGLRLDSPDRRGLELRMLGDRQVLTASPGALSGKCEISTDHLVARCAVGKGFATVVADADLLDTPHLDERAARNLDAVLSELATLQRA